MLVYYAALQSVSRYIVKLTDRKPTGQYTLDESVVCGQEDMRSLLVNGMPLWYQPPCAAISPHAVAGFPQSDGSILIARLLIGYRVPQELNQCLKLE